MTPSSQVFSAQSAQQLLPLLAERLRAPLADPFLPDIVVVPTAGTRDWLIEQLGHRRPLVGQAPALDVARPPHRRPFIGPWVRRSQEPLGHRATHC